MQTKHAVLDLLDAVHAGHSLQHGQRGRLAQPHAQAGALPFARRLILALDAGEAAGGDKRGKQSAALLIHTSEAYPALSLRVDDHADPLVELKRLEAVSRERFVAFASCLPTHEDPEGLTDRAAIEQRIAAATPT